MKYAINLYVMNLQLLEFARSHHTLESATGVIGDAIGAACDELDGLDEADLCDDHKEAIADERTCLVESLLGATFVVCQAQITDVITRSLGLLRMARKDLGHPLGCCKQSKNSLLRLASANVGTTTTTEIELIDAAANYFKHNSEWRGSWAKLEGQSLQTAQKLLSVGITDSSGVLRSAAEILGNAQYRETTVIATKVTNWQIGVEGALRKELKERKLA